MAIIIENKLFPQSDLLTDLSVFSNSSTPDEQIDVAAEKVSVEGAIVSSLSTTIDVTGTGAGGIDASDSAAANDTWYGVHAISNGSGTSSSAMISTSFTAPVTMPAGFTKSRLVGAVRTDGSADLIPFYQVGGFVKRSPILVAGPLSYAGGAVQLISLTSAIPPSRCKRVIVSSGITSANAEGLIEFFSHISGSASARLGALDWSSASSGSTVNGYHPKGELILPVQDGSQNIFASIVRAASPGTMTATIESAGFYMEL